MRDNHITFFLLYILLSSCATTFLTPPSQIDDTPTNPFHLYFWAYYNDLTRNHPAAQKCYDALFRSETSPYIYAGYLHHLFNTNQFEKIVSLTPKVESHFPHNLELQLIVVKALEQTGKQAHADKRIMTLAATHTNNPELIYYGAAAYVRANQSQEAVALIDRYLTSKPERPSHFIFYFMKAQIHLQLFQKDAALAQIEKCLELNPHFEQGWLLSGLLNELSGKIDQALVGYRNFLSIVGNDKAVEQQILNLIIKKQQNNLLPYNDHLFKKAIELNDQKQSKTALTMINQYLSHYPKNTEAQLFKIELLCSQGKAARAVELIKQLIVHDSTNPFWYQVLHVLYEAQVEQKHITYVLRMLEQRYPKNLLPLFYLIDISLKKDDMQTAFYYLNHALTITNDPLMHAKLLYQMALMYYAKKDWTSMIQTLHSCQALKNHFAPAYHLLAYYYATEEKNFATAQKYIDLALIHDKSNRIFLNTQARIWYKQKQYDKASDLIALTPYQLPVSFPHLKYCDKLQNKYEQLSKIN
ncbi:MAG: tetratricopeptide repeat protein [Candidatus Dependentiae bacterium ADurb.Bin331]|nr:MAG: tetratricopeptide repeat protein [Candidatus Dependentiae bacterium ADurb.Bin331]